MTDQLLAVSDDQPSANLSLAPTHPPWKEELLIAVLKPLREDAARKPVMEKYRLDHASIEEFLRSPETRRSVAQALAARLVELIPITVKSLSPEILAKKGWAIKLLLSALRFEKVADQILENTESQADVIISSAFERELVQNLLDTLRGKPDHGTAELQKGDEEQE